MTDCSILYVRILLNIIIIQVILVDHHPAFTSHAEGDEFDSRGRLLFDNNIVSTFHPQTSKP